MCIYCAVETGDGGGTYTSCEHWRQFSTFSWAKKKPNFTKAGKVSVPDGGNRLRLFFIPANRICGICYQWTLKLWDGFSSKLSDWCHIPESVSLQALGVFQLTRWKSSFSGCRACNAWESLLFEAAPAWGAQMKWKLFSGCCLSTAAKYFLDLFMFPVLLTCL